MPEDFKKRLPYEVVEGDRHAARVRIGQRDLWPQEISAVILKTARERAERELGHAVRKAVVTVPAYFDDAQRQATRDAGRIAGLDVVRIVNEPTAAALAYGVGVRNDAPQKIAVFDLGGGTFDVSILQLTPGGGAGLGADCFQVLATAGDTRLGGDDVDRMIVEMLLGEIRSEFYPDLAQDAHMGISPATRQALRNFAEAAKIHLSAHDSAHVRIDLGEGRALDRSITRDEFEGLIGGWAQRAIDCCARAMTMSGIDNEDIERVVMVGGSTRIPLASRWAPRCRRGLSRARTARVCCWM
jgi:molecular chaperone DnaK (HSP70)